MPERRWRVLGRGRGLFARIPVGERVVRGGECEARPRQWVWSVFPSLGLAIHVARGYAAFDGGGRWRVYGTRVAAVGDGRPVEAVLGRPLAEGLETHRQA